MASTSGLLLDFRPYADLLLRLARQYGSSAYRITSAYRSYAQQQRLYEAYLRGESGGLPAARPGTSAHERGAAIDIARADVNALDDPFLVALGGAWKAAGGIWGASDPVHFEWPL